MEEEYQNHGSALLVLAPSRRQGLIELREHLSGNTRFDCLEIMTKALHLQYRVDHPHVFGRSAQEGAIVH